MTVTPLPRPSARFGARFGARLGAALGAVGLAAVGAVAGAAPAQADGAAQIYRYWAYFHVEDGSYVTSDKGLADYVPEDGAVEALRFAAPADFTAPNLPRADLSEVTFDAVCAEEEAAAGEKRVAVLLDPGVEADSEGAEVPAPTAECAVVPQDANALQAVQAVAEVRTGDGGLLCAVDGYPASGCGGTVDSGTPPDEGTVEFAVAGQEGGDAATGEQSTPAADDTDGTDPWVYVLVAALLVALVVGGLLLSRRNAKGTAG